MKIKSIHIILMGMNLISTVLLTVFVHPAFSAFAFLNLFLIPKKKWARVSILILMGLGVLGVIAGFVLSLNIEEVSKLIGVLSSLSFTFLYLVYGLSLFSSKKMNEFYQPRFYIHEDFEEGWKCPKCSSKMVFSVICWNCGLKKEDLDKPIPAASQVEPSNPIDTYIKKKKEEHPNHG
ncbi:MAG: hypothetical protein HYS08_07180 [Chlamydiae bacterium]|nr:hypothetical protein [Chlamydiota bacterium]MBI3265938.1 hypothetical protein [Chlamydiota bacterium]